MGRHVIENACYVGGARFPPSTVGCLLEGSFVATGGLRSRFQNCPDFLTPLNTTHELPSKF